MRKSTPEGHVLRSICEWLAIKGIWYRRMNVGAVRTEGGGFMKFGSPGMADILAVPQMTVTCDGKPRLKLPMPVWIECKAPKGTQSDAQMLFQGEVEAEGHGYCLARSIEDVAQWLKENGA